MTYDGQLCAQPQLKGESSYILLQPKQRETFSSDDGCFLSAAFA